MSNPIAAAQNFDDQWHRIFERCGLQIVVLVLDYRAGSPARDYVGPKATRFGDPHTLGFEETLGRELEQSRIGLLDSTLYPGLWDETQSGIRWHLFHAFDFQKTMLHLKARLEAVGLLSHSQIMHLEAPNQFTIWYSPDPEQIGKTIAPLSAT